MEYLMMDSDELSRRHLDREYKANNKNNGCWANDSPLRQAVRTGNLARVRQLINQYDINVPNYKNWTLIHESAVSDDFSDVFQYLISAGAKIQFKTEGGVSPLYVACRHGSLKIATMLVQAGCEVNESCIFDHEFNMYIPNNFSPLHVACIGNHKDMVAFLIENSADVNAKDFEGRTPTYYALKEKNIDILSLLIDAGADLVTKDIYEGNILYYACRGHFDPEIYSLLESYGLSFINNQSSKGRTALMDAISKGNDTLAEELIQLGADVTLADNDGLLAIHMAALSGYKIFKLLLQHTPADVIEKYSTFQTGSENWHSLPCCIIKTNNFESLKLLYSSDLNEAILSCPDEANDLLLSPIAFLLVSSYYELNEDQFMEFLKFLLSYEFLLDPPYETVRQIPQDDYKFGKKMWLKRLKPVEALIYRHCHDCFDDFYNHCDCKLYLSTILSNSKSHNKMLPYSYSRQLDFFCVCARKGFIQAFELLKYAEYVNPDDVLKEFLKRLMSNPFSTLGGHEESLIKFLLEKCSTNFTTTFLEMKTLALKNLQFGASPMSPNIWRKYETFLEICKMAESNNPVATLKMMCRHNLRKSIKRKAEESMESFQDCLKRIPMPPMLYKQIRYDIG